MSISRRTNDNAGGSGGVVGDGAGFVGGVVGAGASSCAEDGTRGRGAAVVAVCDREGAVGAVGPLGAGGSPTGGTIDCVVGVEVGAAVVGVVVAGLVSAGAVVVRPWPAAVISSPRGDAPLAAATPTP